MGQTGRRSIATHILAVKISSVAAPFSWLRGGPCRAMGHLGVLGQEKKGRGLEKPSPHAKVVPSLPLLFLLLHLLREEDVADGDVHLGDSRSNQVLDPPYDVPAHSLSDLVDGPTVLDAQAQVHCCLERTHLH